MLNRKDIRIGIIAVCNNFVINSTNDLLPYANIETFILKGKDESFSLPNDKNVPAFNKKSLLDLIRFYRLLRKKQKDFDIFIFHYLNPYFLLLILVGTIKKPMVHFCYGSDLRKTGVSKLLIKMALQKMSIIFVEQNEQKLFVQNEFQIPDNKIDSSIVIWNINKCFKIIPEKELDVIKNKWNIKKRYIIFSPRTLSAFYNHHTLLEGINHLDEKWKRDIQVIAKGIHEDSYFQNLLDLASKYKIELTIINKYLSPMEMAELFNLSLINVNIPKNDLFGTSIQEGCLCGSIPLLNIDIPTYHEYMKDKINCFYVKPDSTDIAEKIEDILNRCHHLRTIISKNNVNLFSHRQNSEENSKILVQRLNVVIESSRLP